MLLRSLDRQQRRPGVVILAVLVLVVVLTLAAYQYSEFMIAEYQSAESQQQLTQSKELANSGIHYAAALLANRTAYVNTLGGNPYDNPAAFRDIAVPPLTENGRTGYFSIVGVGPGTPMSEQATYRFGASDESGKINLNALLRLGGNRALQVLMKLPGMTEEVAAAILDWLDTDTTPRSGGAEEEYYSTLNPPYYPKNGPLDSLEELLLVRGVTPQLLFGNDINRNGILDPGEDDGIGFSHQGLSGWLTVYSRELNVDNEGNPRIYLNDPDTDTLYENLNAVVGQELADFIYAYRLYGGTTSSSSGGRFGSTTRLSSNNQTIVQGNLRGSRGGGRGGGGGGGGNTRIRSLFDLVGAQVNIPNGDSTITYNSPLNDPALQSQLLPLLLDKTTTTDPSTTMELRPRINVNTAPYEVLVTLPGLDVVDAQSIAANQPVLAALGGGVDPIYETPAWLVTHVQLTPQKLRSIERYITGRSLVYRVQAVGYFLEGGPTARIEAVIDTNAGRPRIVYWRNLGELGRGFDFLMPTQGIDDALVP
jgi:hypothetical protein